MTTPAARPAVALAGKGAAGSAEGNAPTVAGKGTTRGSPSAARSHYH
ncbi:hypothetical protein [Streptomyces eurocidicus]|uniref:Uncharacterized protein n=1 Tax=Streptomyces eurocidicus TaxID=66423 RepID=A0A7W8B7G5_STREU|nr:hypothetical protein [Streptomyces eurocidicus]MBB5118225.1 hypothetical protein [Streptomyces eurocidicus]MBF6054604.1 hypothetical protein [Streptomyces eurocidicus]